VLELKLLECRLLDSLFAVQTRAARYWSLPVLEMIKSSNKGILLAFVLFDL
jgi:hypothetical protein